MQDKRLFLCDKEGNPAMEVAGFGISGVYLITHRNGSYPAWQTRCRYMAHDSGHPVAAIFPGYRMRGVAGHSCNMLAQALHELSFPVLILDYGGTSDNKSETIDDATMTTNIHDCAAAISYLGEREHMHFPISYGINISMQTVTAQTRGVVGIVAAPDRFQRVIHPQIDMDQAIERGYVRHHMGYAAKMKITAAFLMDCMQYSLFDPGMSMRTHKPPMSLVAGEHDLVVPPEYIGEWAQFLRQCGYQADVSVIPEKGHRADGDVLDRILQEALKMRDHVCPLLGSPGLQLREAVCN